MSDAAVSNANAILNEKKRRTAKTLRREKVDKVPLLMIADAYVPYYAGKELTDITSYDKAIEVLKFLCEDLQMDCNLAPFMPANLMLSPLSKILGGSVFTVSEKNVKQIVPANVQILKPEEYPALIKDPINYLLEVVYPRRFELLRSDNVEDKFTKFLQVFQHFQTFGEYVNKSEIECNTPIMNNILFMSPIDIILDFLRDFTGIVGDTKRCPDLLRDAGLVMADDISKFFSSQPIEYKANVVPMHLPAFLSAKDFEKIYWPSLKKLTESVAAQGHNIAFCFEKKYSHLYEFLQDLPKQHVLGIFEEDDMRVVKKKLGGTMAIAGGLSTDLMYYGTKQECIDHVKSLIDDLGQDGGYFICNDTPMMFPVDAKPENLKAVCDTIATYGKY